MNTHKTKDGLQINILSRVKFPGYFVYKIELINTTEDKLHYDLTKLESKNGLNACKNRDFQISGIPALRKGKLEIGEAGIGLIIFQPNHNNSSVHEFMLDGEKFKAKHKKELI